MSGSWLADTGGMAGGGWNLVQEKGCQIRDTPVYASRWPCREGGLFVDVPSSGFPTFSVITSASSCRPLSLEIPQGE